MWSARTNTIASIGRKLGNGVVIQRQIRFLANEASFKIERPCKTYLLPENTFPTEVSVTREDGLKMYEIMQMTRRMETAAANLYKEKAIRGFCHLYSGQEAVAVGIKFAMEKQDTVVTSYRDHGWAYIMGVPVAGVLGELTGREVGCSRGKGGSMHMYAPNFYGGNGIVGAMGPLGAGLALGHQYIGDKGVAVTLYGDGAANQGQLFEAFNMAALWKLPVLYICENNKYGMGTSAKRSSAETQYYKRGQYIPGVWVDGMDVLAMRSATKIAMDMCRNGEGPIVMEASSYRYHGHSMSDPGTSYRTRDEVQEVRKTLDPINSFKDKMLKGNLATEDDFKEIDKKIKTEVDEAVKIAKSSPEATDFYGDVYALCLEDEIRGTIATDTNQHINIGKPVNLDLKL